MLRSASLTIIAIVLAVAAGGAATAAGPDDLLPDAPAKALVVRACTTCHQASQVVARRRTAEDWDEMVGKMVDRGAQASEVEQQQIADYLAKYFGPAPTSPMPSGGPGS